MIRTLLSEFVRNKWALTILIISVTGGISLVLLSYGKQFTPGIEYDRIAKDLYRQGKYEEAIREWEKVLEIDPEDSKTMNKIGMAYLESEQFDKAAQFYAVFCKICPHDLNLRYNLALTYFKQDRLQECGEELDKVQQANSLFPQVHYLRGLVYEKGGEVAQAEKEFIKEINMNPDCLGAWYKVKKYREGGRQ